MGEIDTRAGSAMPTGTRERPAGRAGAPRARAVLAASGGGVLLVALGTAAHLWFVPFVVGGVVGTWGSLRSARAGTGVLCAGVAAALGWALPLALRSIDAEPVLATARVAAALAGLPPTGWLILAVTLLVALLQGVLGAWSGRALHGLVSARRTSPAG
ncbi:hypothetical protein ACFWIQ_31735 [Kitasatospora sp. NPDC127059]|uniref:hypothetical protein n=1 Tax=unclassified Kitasatospora TaxID=2633591 RepID=UPI0036656124